MYFIVLFGVEFSRCPSRCLTLISSDFLILLIWFAAMFYIRIACLLAFFRECSSCVICAAQCMTEDWASAPFRTNQCCACGCGLYQIREFQVIKAAAASRMLVSEVSEVKDDALCGVWAEAKLSLVIFCIFLSLQAFFTDTRLACLSPMRSPLGLSSRMRIIPITRRGRRWRGPPAGRADQTLHLRHNNQLRRLHKILGSMKISETSEAFW